MKEPRSSTREQILNKTTKFSYFKNWSESTIAQLCTVSKIRSFEPEEIILGGTNDQTSYVYFITEGSCRVVECVTFFMKTKKKQRAKKCFVDVCALNELSCFNIGENLENRQIVAVTRTNCLMIPFYWLLENNEANIWVRMRQFLNWNVPKTENIVRILRNEQKWRVRKQKLVETTLKRNVGNIQFYEVPYSLKVVY